MDSQKLPNYLRTARRRYGFSQGEVAYLLGCGGSEQICRYERFHQRPRLRTFLAYHVLFRLPPSELFGGVYDDIQRLVRRRAQLLAARLDSMRTDAMARRKLLVLQAVINNTPIDESQ